MSMLNLHHLYCQRFLDQFSEAQEKLLKLNLTDSAHEFELLFDCFKRECQKNISRFTPDKNNKSEYRLLKQLDLICKHIHKLSSSLTNLKNPLKKAVCNLYNFTPEQVIKYFEEQHRFKKVLKNHIRDLKEFRGLAQDIRA